MSKDVIKKRKEKKSDILQKQICEPWKYRWKQTDWFFLGVKLELLKESRETKKEKEKNAMLKYQVYMIGCQWKIY